MNFLRLRTGLLGVVVLAAISQEQTQEAPTLDPSSWPTFADFHYAPINASPVRSDEYRNPILPGCHPDPTICRVGDEFFLANSSFAVFPGVPIYKSRDLIHWKAIGHILDRPSQLPTDGIGVSEGIYAPALSYHDGLFYMITTNVGHGGNFFVTAKNPAGPWSEPTWLPGVDGIDPSLFFDDDGKGYVVHNGPAPDNKPAYEGHRSIRLHTFSLGGDPVVPRDNTVLVNGGVDLAKKPVWIEGPHLFKRNGKYYLLCAEGGTGDDHSEVVFIADSVWGPYKPFKQNPILTQRDLPNDRPNKITSTGHADLVTTPDGQWWSVFLGIRPYEGPYANLGRETFLLPVTWNGDWPIILPPKTPIDPTHSKPNLPDDSAGALDVDQPYETKFDTDTPDFSWVFLRTPHEKWYKTAHPGLQVEPRDVPLTSKGNPSMLMRRQEHQQFTATTRLMLSPQTLSCQSGIVAFQNETHYLFLGVRCDSGKTTQIFLEQASSKDATTAPQRIASTDLPSNASQIELRIRSTGRPYGFDYRVGDGDWQTLKADVDGSILSTQIAGGFVGTYLGLYARK